MRPIITVIFLLFALSANAQRQRDGSWRLVWHDEFDGTGVLDSSRWQAERGFVRNEEDQWYQEQNAYRLDGILILEARLDSIPNPGYNPQRQDWRSIRPFAKYTSASVNTRQSYSFRYGQMEVRARIPAVDGAWPAIWTLGTDGEWPSNGECDVMEFYHINNVPHILANAAWGNDKPWNAVWNSKRIPYRHFLDSDPWWGEKFHVWLMDWTEDFIRIYLDGELINDIDLHTTINGIIGHGANPFHAPQYILLDLALGGINGGHIQPEAFPMRYEVDYVRVFQIAEQRK